MSEIIINWQNITTVEHKQEMTKESLIDPKAPWTRFVITINFVDGDYKILEFFDPVKYQNTLKYICSKLDYQSPKIVA